MADAGGGEGAGLRSASLSGGNGTYDAIIVGASFAGLAVASQLKGFRVLILDPKDIGTGQTSACGTILPALEHMDLADAVVQVHDHLVLHTARRTLTFRSPYRWCTFDYASVCRTLFRRSGASHRRAAVAGYRDGAIYAGGERFTATCVVDASGWRSVVASSLAPGFSTRDPMNLGVETIRPIGHGDLASGLHFWYDREILEGGVGWVFPRDGVSSVGVGSYGMARPLGQALARFVGRFGAEPGGLHGTYFPFKLRRATVGPVFVVGDAAGMCIGLTGEGIRPALFFGEACGRMVRRVLSGEWTLREGLTAYESFVERRRAFFDLFYAVQWVLTRLPVRWVDRVAQVIQHDRIRPWVLRKYWGLTGEWEMTGGKPAGRARPHPVYGGKGPP